MKKNVIKLNENTLRQMVAESVKRVLKEEFYNDKTSLLKQICAKYSNNDYDGGWPAEFDGWIPVEAHISHIDGKTATANLRIGDVLQNGGTPFEQEIPLSQLPIKTLQDILSHGDNDLDRDEFNGDASNEFNPPLPRRR